MLLKYVQITTELYILNLFLLRLISDTIFTRRTCILRQYFEVSSVCGNHTEDIRPDKNQKFI
jgi:hypothetical protein